MFDQIFQVGDGGYRIPYPFSRLLEQLDLELAPSGSAGGLPAVLIPRGRSLQRDAARPDYYRFPRIVIALDRPGIRPRLVKNRLFLGFQEKAGTIEVISYNETAGRFEFQLVENYADGQIPRVRYANRTLCTSCHQNAAPIFARPLWRETNFDTGVAERIGEYRQRYHGIEVARGEADRIDFATDQANLLQAYQQVWQRGCPDRGCRAALFNAALQRRLAAVSPGDYQWLPVELELLASLRANWARLWPDGMPVASADIDDRIAADGDDRLAPELSPLAPRPALTHWSYRSAARRTIEGIGDQFLPERDLERLRRLNREQAIDKDQISAAVARLAKSAQPDLFAGQPIQGIALTRALMRELGYP